MSFTIAMIISDDCASINLEQLKNVYGVSFKEVNNPQIKQQIDTKQKVYIFSDDKNGYFWNNWTPVGAEKVLKAIDNVPPEEREESHLRVVATWEKEFNRRYISFEAQMYIVIIKYLKIICGVQDVGLVGFMLDDSNDKCQFPIFDKKIVGVDEMTADTLYQMKENCIYYFN